MYTKAYQLSETESDFLIYLAVIGNLTEDCILTP